MTATSRRARRRRARRHGDADVAATTGPTCRTSRSSTTRSTHDADDRSRPGAAGSTPARSRVAIVGRHRAHRARRGRAGEVGVAPSSWRTSLLLFGNSALYHRFDWSPKTKAVLKRIDHANIFLLIAGTYTPLAVLALPPDKGALLLVARLGRRAPRHPVPRVLDRRAALALRRALPRCSAGPR